MCAREERCLYEIIGCMPTDTTEQIEKAYRKKSLSCHPDKHPDNPQATDSFLELKSALEVLIDPQRRADYDRRVANAKFQAKLKARQRETKRQKLIDDLETHDEVSFKCDQLGPNRCRPIRKNGPNLYEAQKRKAEIDRLQKEGSWLLRKTMYSMTQQILNELGKDETDKYDEKFTRVKLKWRVAENDPTHGGYDYATLHKILSKYGEIVQLILLARKEGRGLVQFKNKEAAESAVQIETGFVQNPLILEGLWTVEKKRTSYVDFQKILANLRRADDRKRLVEEMRSEEEGEHG